MPVRTDMGPVSLHSFLARAFSTGAGASAAGARKSLFAGVTGAAVAATAGIAYYQSTVYRSAWSFRGSTADVLTRL